MAQTISYTAMPISQYSEATSASGLYVLGSQIGSDGKWTSKKFNLGSVMNTSDADAKYIPIAGTTALKGNIVPNTSTVVFGSNAKPINSVFTSNVKLAPYGATACVQISTTGSNAIQLQDSSNSGTVRIGGIAAPTSENNAANKGYVDAFHTYTTQAISGSIELTAGTLKRVEVGSQSAISFTLGSSKGTGIMSEYMLELVVSNTVPTIT